MPPSKTTFDLPSNLPTPGLWKDGLESVFISKLRELKYDYREDITNRAALEANFREKFEALNRVRLTDGEFARLLDEIITPDVFTAAKTLRQINAFTRDDGTPLKYTQRKVEGRRRKDERVPLLNSSFLLPASPTLLCFLQLFIVSNRESTYDAANTNAPPFRLQSGRALPAHLPVRRPPPLLWPIQSHEKLRRL